MGFYLDHVYFFRPGMWFLHGPVNHEVTPTMIDRLFDGIRWVTTWMNSAGRAGFSVVVPAAVHHDPDGHGSGQVFLAYGVKF